MKKHDVKYLDFKEGVDILSDLMKYEKNNPEVHKMHTRYIIEMLEERLIFSDLSEEERKLIKSTIKSLKELVKEV